MSEIRKNYEAIAIAIRNKKGSHTAMTPAEMPDEIASIPTGITPTGTKSITTNGTHDVTQFANAEVNVPNPSTGTKEITENGDYDVTAFASAHVDVAGGIDAGPVPEYLGASLRNYYMDTESYKRSSTSYQYLKAPYKGIQIYQIKASAPDNVVIEPYYKINDVIYPVIEIRYFGTMDGRTGNVREVVCPKTMQYFNYYTSGQTWPKKFTKISVDPENQWFMSPDNCGCLISKFSPFNPEVAANYLIMAGDLGFIPTGVQQLHIGEGAFYQNKSLTSIHIPSNVIDIGKQAFYECSNLTEITFDSTGWDSYINIQTEAFAKCGQLQSEIEFPSVNGSVSLGKNWFKNTYAPSIEFSSTLSYDSSNVGLNSGLLPSFDNTEFKVKSLPTVTRVGDSSEWTMEFEGITLSSLTKYEGAYYFGDINNPYKILVCADWYPDGAVSVNYNEEYTRKELDYTENFPIHPGCSVIADKAFINCTSLISLASGFFNNIDYIGRQAFYKTNIAGDLVLSRYNAKIAPKAFSYTKITRLTLNWATVESQAFYGCSSLTQVTGYLLSTENTSPYCLFGCSNLSIIDLMVEVSNRTFKLRVDNSALSSVKFNKDTLGLYDSDADPSCIQINALSHQILKEDKSSVEGYWISSGLQQIDGFFTEIKEDKFNKLKVSADNPLFAAENNILYTKDKSAVLYIPTTADVQGALTFSNNLKELNNRGSRFTKSVKTYSAYYPVEPTYYTYWCNNQQPQVTAVTTFNIPSGLEFISYSFLTLFPSVSTITIPYNQNNKYFTSDDGKALFAKGTDLDGGDYDPNDLILVWADLQDGYTWPTFEIDGTQANYKFTGGSTCRLFKNCENLEIDTVDDVDLMNILSHSYGGEYQESYYQNNQAISAEKVTLHDNCYQIDDCEKALNNIHTDYWCFDGSCSGYRYTTWYDTTYLYYTEIHCNDGIVKRKSDESSSNNNGEYSY